MRPRYRREPVEARIFLFKPTLARRSKITVRMLIHLNIGQGWIVHAHEPLAEKVQPLNVRLEENPAAVLKNIAYPQGERVFLPYQAGESGIYRDQAVIKGSLVIHDYISRADQELYLNLIYHLSNHRRAIGVQEQVYTFHI